MTEQKKPDSTKKKAEAGGFLPFHTNAFDRGFIGAVVLIAIHLLWLRFVEPLLPDPSALIALPLLISLLIGYFIVRKG